MHGTMAHPEADPVYCFIYSFIINFRSVQLFNAAITGNDFL